MSRITVEVSEQQHIRIKALAAVSGMTIKDLILQKVFDTKPTTKQKRPNKATLEAIHNAEKKQNIKSYKNIDDLFKKLGI